MDFYSMLLARKLKKESGGDVTIESLVVTENGNYSEAGKAYSPVVVNVPFPENGYLLESESGQAINITDGAPLYLQACVANIEPIQDLHGYDKPWVGGAGKNLYIGSPDFKGYSSNGTWESVLEQYNGHPVMKQTAKAWGGLYKRIYLENGTYTFSAMVKTSSSAEVFLFAIGTPDAATISPEHSEAYTIGTSWTRLSFSFQVTTAGYVALRVEASTNVDLYVSEYQLEKNSSATVYEPYSNICPISGRTDVKIKVQDTLDNPTSSKTYTIQLGDTIYGGELDVVTGELTVTHKSVDLGELSWTFSDGFFRTNELIATVKKPINNQTMVNAISSIYPIMTWADITSADTAIAVSVAGQMRVGNPNITSVADFVTAVSGQSLVYELAEPQTIQLTPKQIRLLEGVNNLSCNTGELNIEYFEKGVN